ncbi:MAG: hypothetical protein ACE5IE_03630 [Dehalococcoidia bacterium]
MTSEEKDPVPEKAERRLVNLERNFKILLALILVSLGCSLAALIIAFAVLLMTL